MMVRTEHRDCQYQEGMTLRVHQHQFLCGRQYQKHYGRARTSVPEGLLGYGHVSSTAVRSRQLYQKAEASTGQTVPGSERA
eukprot:2924326-Rhodomonas_salina.2